MASGPRPSNQPPLGLAGLGAPDELDELLLVQIAAGGRRDREPLEPREHVALVDRFGRGRRSGSRRIGGAGRGEGHPLEQLGSGGGARLIARRDAHLERQPGGRRDVAHAFVARLVPE